MPTIEQRTRDVYISGIEQITHVQQHRQHMYARTLGFGHANTFVASSADSVPQRNDNKKNKHKTNTSNGRYNGGTIGRETQTIKQNNNYKNHWLVPCTNACWTEIILSGKDVKRKRCTPQLEWNMQCKYLGKLIYILWTTYGNTSQHGNLRSHNLIQHKLLLKSKWSRTASGAIRTIGTRNC